MDGNREKQIKESHITQSAGKQPGTGPIHVVIMPTSLTMGQQQKPLTNNRISEPVMNYSSYSAAAQTRGKSVRLLLMPAPSPADQQLPWTSNTKQSERKVLLLPNSVVKQPKNAPSQSYQVNQPRKKVQVLTAMTGHKIMICNTPGVENCTDTHDDPSDSNSVLIAASPKDEGQNTRMTGPENDSKITQSSHSYVNLSDEATKHSSVSSLSSEALQCENMNASKTLEIKEECISESRPGMVSPHLIVTAASPKEEGRNTHMAGPENDSKITQSSHSYVNQSDEASKYSSVSSLSSEGQQCENLNASKNSRLKEEYISDCPNSRPGMVPQHLMVMTASHKEIDYRIKAFLARKRAELDIQNVEEYCLHIGMNPNVCARVDATVHQHRKRKKRTFEFAPQPEEKEEGKQFMSKDASQEQLPLSVAHPILEERVYSAEEHLRLGKPVPKDIYSRLKRIEDRILQLEGISPEYTYDATVNLHPRRTLPKIKKRCTIDELDAKIAELQKKFQKKPDASR